MNIPTPTRFPQTWTTLIIGWPDFEDMAGLAPAHWEPSWPSTIVLTTIRGAVLKPSCNSFSHRALAPGSAPSPSNSKILRVPKLYRGFESLPLRHAVWDAAKIGCIPLKITGNRRNSAALAPQTGPEKMSRRTPKLGFVALFLWRTHGQSAFNESIRRTECDHKPMVRRKCCQKPMRSVEIFVRRRSGDDTTRKRLSVASPTHRAISNSSSGPLVGTATAPCKCACLCK
jgi:hypothetical protein